MIESYERGPDVPPLWNDTLADCLDRATARHLAADAVVVCHQQRRLTYSAFHDEVERTARGLLTLDVRKGDRVGVLSGNCVEWLITQHAVARVGAVLVTLNPAYRALELERTLRHAGVSLLVAAGGRRAAALLDVVPELATARSDRLRANRLPALRDVVAIGAGAPPGCLPWDELRARAARVDAETLRARRLEIRGSDPAVIMFTSGTTGMPKGVVLSHRQIVNGGMLVAHRLRYTAADRVCLPLPLHHVLGNVAAGVAALTHGCALVLPCDTFDAPACLAAIEGERCTSLYGVPTMFLTLLEHATFDTRRTVSLRTGVVSGMSCPPDLLRRIVEQLRVPQLTVGYGMTEMAPILFSSVDDSLDDRASTTGKVQPHVECMVVDPATGRPAPRGERGEVVARGYCVMQGYWQDPEATRQTIDAAGWLHTGDLGVMRRDGSVSIVGRLKDLVIRGGENIAPREIEELLREHPKVADAQVIGVPDREYGEELCAWIRLRDNQTASRDELRQHCRTRLAAHKIPRHICFASEFPTTASGKVQRFRLQEMAIAALNLYTPDAAANAAYDRRAAGH